MLAGCSSLPSDGPQYGAVQRQYDRDEQAHAFALVDISAHTIEQLRLRPHTSIAASFPPEATAGDLLVGPGDSIRVSIWEAGTETLFSGSQTRSESGALPSARSVDIPEQRVGADGAITVPFAGRIPVVGKTPSQIQELIEKALSGKASRPQALVSVAGNRANMVTVIGEVITGARVPLSGSGDRLLDVIAAAGGVRSAAYETSISLTRDAATVSLPMSEVLRNPRENVYVRGGDSIVVTRSPKTYSALGATGRPSQIPFESSGVSLIEAVAKAGGIVDSRADPRGVYLFRLESQDMALKLGVVGRAAEPSDMIPVIYRLDLTQAGSYFLGQAFEMRDRDIIYVASAPTHSVMKFLQLLGAAAQPIIQGVIIDRSLK
ncbi:MAG: sugar transporter [Panacagrimonas sp.]|jgi:polysaccharide export outer membrane protein|nr:polysaccharide biosynthesis/export family protein [Panacagrimonas sp.]MCC2656682.1 sugar transporter [Panacagrimonas sp.]